MTITTAADVREALMGRYPPDQYLSIYEAPQDSDRSGRKLDVVVVSLWRSRGLQRDGIEIKVSMSDWKRELDEPAKADWWHARVNRFWIAAPAEVAKKIKPQLPVGWGLLSCADSGVRAMVTPEPNLKPEAITWPVTVGLLRATANTGVNVLHREYQRGVTAGREAAAKHQVGAAIPDAQAQRAVRELETLRASVAAFEEASGVKIDRYSGNASRTGAIVRLVQDAIHQGPDVIDRRLADQVAQLRAIAETTEKLQGALTKAMVAS